MSEVKPDTKAKALSEPQMPPHVVRARKPEPREAPERSKAKKLLGFAQWRCPMAQEVGGAGEEEGAGGAPEAVPRDGARPLRPRKPLGLPRPPEVDENVIKLLSWALGWIVSAENGAATFRMACV